LERICENGKTEAASALMKSGGMEIEGIVEEPLTVSHVLFTALWTKSG